MLTGHATVLLVENMHQAPDSYGDRLGSEVVLYEEDGYGTAERDDCYVRLAHGEGVKARPNHEFIPPDMFDFYFWPDDVDAMHTELQHRGATVIQSPTDQPYGLREFRVRDPDGHILASGKRITHPS